MPPAAGAEGAGGPAAPPSAAPWPRPGPLGPALPIAGRALIFFRLEDSSWPFFRLGINRSAGFVTIPLRRGFARLNKPMTVVKNFTLIHISGVFTRFLPIFSSYFHVFIEYTLRRPDTRKRIDTFKHVPEYEQPSGF